MPAYFRVPWPDQVLPEGEPAELLYEVDENDSVPRMVELFPDGRIERDSIENDPGPWGSIPSLVHGEWSVCIEGVEGVKVIQKAEFEAVWAQGVFKTHPR